MALLLCQFFSFTQIPWLHECLHVFWMNTLTCLHSPQCLLTAAAAAAVGAAVGFTDLSPDQIFVGFSQQRRSASIVWTDRTSRELFHLPGGLKNPSW